MRMRRSGLWSQTDFLRLWAADTVSQFGSQVSLLALPLAAVLNLHAGPAQMGLLTAAGTAPALLFSLVAGAWIDRLRRRPLLIAADFGRAAVLLTIPVVWALGVLQIWILYVVAFLAGALTVVFNVAHVSFLPSLVDHDRLVEGNSKLRFSASVAQSTGPGLAGVLVGAITAPFAILTDALSFLVSGLLIARIRAAEPAPSPVERHSIRQDVRFGLRAVFGNPVLRAMVCSSGALNLAAYIFLAVYVLYMVRDLGFNSTAVGLVFGLGGVGALIGAMLAQPVARRLGTGRAIILGLFLFGIGGLTIPLAVVARGVAVPLVLAAEFLQWLTFVIATVNQVSLRQAMTPHNLLGRVNATWQFVVAGSVSIGSLLGGALGDAIGVRATLVVGVVGMLIAFLWLLWSPLRTVREIPAPAEEVAAAVA